MKTKVLVVASQKGGVGKTTVTMALGDGLAREGKRVLIVDADPQKTAYKWESRKGLGLPRYPVRVEANSGLAVMEFLEYIVGLADDAKSVSGEELDFILVDTPPNLKSGDLEAALFVSDEVIVPVKPNRMATEAMEELFSLFVAANEVRRKHKRGPLDVKVMVNFMQAKRVATAAMVEQLQNNVAEYSKRDHVRAQVLTSQFKHLAAFENAPNYRTSFYCLPGSKDARAAIESLVKEIA